MKPKRRYKQKVVDHDKRRKRMVFGFGIIMIFLMVFSIVGVINHTPSGDTQLQYGDVEFVLENRPHGGSVLVATLGNQQLEFQNLPTQVGFLDVDPSAVGLLQTAQQIALTADPSLDLYTLGLIDYARLQLGLGLQKAYTAMTAENTYNLPIVSCANATWQTPVVYFNITNETAQITVEDYCLVMHGQEQDLMRLKDRILFEYYGILQNGEVVA